MDVRCSGRPLSGGFSLLELMITLAVTAILVTMVAPAFSRLLAQTRITTAINDLVTHVQLSRSEAIKRGVRVGICPSADGANCLGRGQWTDGWLVFVDENSDRNHNPPEPILQVQASFPPQVTVDGGARDRIIYQPDGSLLGGLNGTYIFCDASNTAPPKAVIISLPGRPRVSERRADGSALRCR
ncbi:MAG: Tfp pilus assembly protein FimT/FimU [Gammaproteobacteria bacterium]